MARSSPSTQIPFEFGDFQKNDLNSFLIGKNEALIKLIKKIVSQELQHFVYLWGTAATGKTHLLQAACKQAAVLDQHVGYIPLAQIDQLSVTMLHDLGELDLVCIDDIEYSIGKIEWQQAITWLYNELRNNNHSLIISGRQAPTTIKLELADLKSRLCADQSQQIHSPDDELKAAILKQIAHQRAFELSDEVVSFLLRRVERDLPSLISIVDRMDHVSLAEKRKITVPFVKQLINSPST